MEHLMPQGRPAPITVPYLLPDDFSWDSGDFETYPERNGWDFTLWRSRSLEAEIWFSEWLKSSEKTIDELAAFLQAWLFFGYLNMSFQGKVHLEDFVRTAESSASKWITTSNLSTYVEDRIYYMKTDPPTQMRDSVFEMLRAARRTVEHIMPVMYMAYPERSSKFELLLAVGFSISLLVRAMDEIGFALRGDALPYSSDISLLLEQRMLSEGWCPYTIAHLLNQSLDTGVYAYALGTTRTNQDHMACSAEACTAYQTGDNFEAAHVLSGCDCRMVGPQMDEIIRILEEGDIPIIQINYMQKGMTRSAFFNVRKSQSLNDYIAISHVWADGLGNMRENSIPQCQLDLLHHALTDAEEEDQTCTWFWLDTLCIPADEKFQHLRDFSISRMHNIYKRSLGVLVIDRDLNLSSKSSGFCEIATRVAFSAWASRLWTYQEGSLPPRLFVRVQDGKVDLWNLYLSEFQQDSLSALESKLLRTVSRRMRETVPERSAEDSSFELSAQGSIRAMRGRITSRWNDETICIATSLGLDPTPLLTCGSHEDRMIKMLKILPHIPLNILFSDVREHEYLAHEGFRWAPKSLLSAQGGVGRIIDEHISRRQGKNYTRPPAHLHPEEKGIMAYLPAVWLSMADLSKGIWLVKLDDGRCLRHSFRRHPGNSRSENRLSNAVLLLHAPLDTVDQTGNELSGFNTLVVARQDGLAQAGDVNSRLSQPRGESFLRGRVIAHGLLMKEMINVARNFIRFETQGHAMEPQWWLLDGMRNGVPGGALGMESGAAGRERRERLKS
ncbi:hypothetical protein NA57DRAFT_72058 [Rhizodiscina lignyota]|uniref:Heterokaryon incompatibility domain-containing protein n=1 Tax=Rhizodiscina lignyota TaxID=1504668 RepID=A0A9P4IPL0_9PEZI|nr:hypothetical protein NA57DRAFT_72058 [Rhizodiscina lignyota]